MSWGPQRALSARPVVAASALLLVIGFGADLGYTRRQVEGYERALERRVSLMEVVQKDQIRDREARAAAAYLGGEDLDEVLETLASEDAVTFLDRSVREAGLRRRELSTHENRSVGQLQRTSFFVEVTGSYDRVHAFLRQLEESPRVVVTEGILMTPVPGSNQIELRLDLAVYDPR